MKTDRKKSVQEKIDSEMSQRIMEGEIFAFFVGHQEWELRMNLQINQMQYTQTLIFLYTLFQFGFLDRQNMIISRLKCVGLFRNLFLTEVFFSFVL